MVTSAAAHEKRTEPARLLYSFVGCCSSGTGQSEFRENDSSSLSLLVTLATGALLRANKMIRAAGGDDKGKRVEAELKDGKEQKRKLVFVMVVVGLVKVAAAVDDGTAAMPRRWAFLLLPLQTIPTSNSP